jgi:ABC-2 type transport system ATP-binding protein
LDADDRTALTAELSGLGVPFTINGRVTVPFEGTPQGIISRLKTDLTVLRINEPSLEDAYIEFLNKERAA